MVVSGHSTLNYGRTLNFKHGGILFQFTAETWTPYFVSRAFYLQHHGHPLFYKLPGLSKWHKTGGNTKEHNNTSTHKESISKLEDFEDRFSYADLTVPFSFGNKRQQRIETLR